MKIFLVESLLSLFVIPTVVLPKYPQQFKTDVKHLIDSKRSSLKHTITTRIKSNKEP